MGWVTFLHDIRRMAGGLCFARQKAICCFNPTANCTSYRQKVAVHAGCAVTRAGWIPGIAGHRMVNGWYFHPRRIQTIRNYAWPISTRMATAHRRYFWNIWHHPTEQRTSRSLLILIRGQSSRLMSNSLSLKNEGFVRSCWFVSILLTDQNMLVFSEGTTAAGIPLNDEKFGMLCKNHLYIVRERIW